MSTRYTLAAVAFVAALAPTLGAAAPANRQSAGLSFPVQTTSTEQGTFTGTLHIRNFAAADDKIFAHGLLTGTLVDENGATSAIVRTVSVPLIMPVARMRTGEAVAAAACGILHLELGPLDLDLLGLVVHLDKVVLDISAEPGSGNLLGNLLCAIAGLLDGAGVNLNFLANLLNALLGLLT